MDNPATDHGGPVTRPDIAETKPALRRRLRGARATYGASDIIVPRAFRSRLSPGTTVASYIAIGAEADPAPLGRAARDIGCTLALPHVIDRAGMIRFLVWGEGSPLVCGAFGLHQPHADAVEVIPDIVLTPLLGFDRTGNRLGQGAGHYDRAFAACPAAWRIGVGYAVQETVLCPDPWDVPLHAIVTDKEWIEI